MLDGYEEVWEMAAKLGLPPKPLWWDQFGCPRWQEPKEQLRMFVKPIRCQACGQEFKVCLVDDVYRSYSKGKNFIFHGTLPKHWSYGDPPNHPDKNKWEGEWWKNGWDVICMGVTMTSISEWEWNEWDFENKTLPLYKEENLAENEKKKPE